MVATFDAMDAAAQTVSDIIAAKIIPCTLEFLDRTTIRCVEDFAKVGLPTDCEALLLMETDGHPAQVAEEADQMVAIARRNGSREVRIAKDDAEANQLAAARRSAFSALVNQPYSFAFGGASILLADTFNNRVRAIDNATGAVTTLAGSGTRGFADGASRSAAFT